MSLRIVPRLLWTLLLGGLCAGRLAAQKNDGTLHWKFSTSTGHIFSSPAASADGATVYVGVVFETSPDQGLILANNSSDGSLLWQFPKSGDPLIRGVESSPALSPDGKTLYFGCDDGKLYALDTKTGAKIGVFNTNAAAIPNSPSVSADGTVYIVSSDQVLFALTPDLSPVPRWTHPAGYTLTLDTSVSLGSDGTIYFGAFDENVYALNPDGTEKWPHVAAGAAILTSPAIGPDGTLYVALSDSTLAAVTRDGVKWKYQAGDQILAAPSLAADGTIYFGSADNFFYALKPDGSLKWRRNIGNAVITTPAVRGDGTIIFGANDYFVHAFNPDGSPKWSFATDGAVQSSPVIAADGSTYFGSDDGKLYALYGTSAPPSPLSNFSSWPMFHHDAAHSGRTTIATGNAYLVNVSTLAQAGGGSNLIAGFVVQGSASKNFLVRGVGPSLTDVIGVPNTLRDPALSLVSGGVEVAANDSWNDNFLDLTNATNGVTFQLGAGEKDAAVALSLTPGNYNAVVRSVDGSSGVALVEAYDLQAGSTASHLVNISTRAQSNSSVGPLTAGFVIGGTGTLRVLVRAIGPGLAQFNVNGFLAHPMLRLFDSTQKQLATYASWTAGGLTEDLAAAARLTGAFALSPAGAGAADSAAVVTLAPGGYTIQVSSTDGGTGEALVEVYAIP